MANPQQEARLKRGVIDKLSNSCAFVASTVETNTKTGTPDLVCVQKAQYKPYTRLAETTYHGEIGEEKRQELKEIAEQTGDNIKMEAHYRPSPRKKTSRTLKKEGWSQEKINEKIDEFKQAQGLQPE